MLPKSLGLHCRRVSRYTAVLSNPLIVKTPLGMLSGIDVLAMSLLTTLLVWTFYTRISNDYKKLIPPKSMKLNIWQLKLLKIATRLGLLAEICLAFLLLPILRGLSILRLLGIQFEASVRYHIWLGTSMILFATLHGAGTLFIWGTNHQTQNQMWRWQKEGRIYLAGEIALATGLIIWVSSLPFIRRKRFDVFYYIHHMYVVFILFFLLHVGDRQFYMVLPGVFLFSLDKLLRVILSRPETQILSVRIFPSKIIELTLPKHPRLKYTPTSIIFLKIPIISRFHWHPFSITSSSSVDDQTISVMIKCEGWWTNSVYDVLHQEINSSCRTKCIPVAVEGPYGPASFDFTRYDHLILIGGGIGITPILSLIQEIASAKGRFPTEIQLIYATKKSHDISLLNSISHIVLNQPSKLCHLKLRVFVTQEKMGSSTVRELLSEFSGNQTILFDMKRSNYALRLCNLLLIAAIPGFSSVIFLLSLCFFNHFVLKVPKKKPSNNQSTPSTVVDFFLICSFLIAVICSAMVVMVFRWRSVRKSVLSNLDVGGKCLESGSMEEGTHEEHEIHYGSRPIFPEILSELESKFGGSTVGVVVCGPESMNESVALACQQKSQAFKMGPKKEQQPFFVFHPLNFTL